jgi:predicted enzyme related to lactoylglutathione lyase
MSTRKTSVKKEMTAKKPAAKKSAKTTQAKKPAAGVTGIGGIFFKSDDPAALMAWYGRHLGIQADEWGGKAFRWREESEPKRLGYTVFSPFPRDTKYFEPGELPYMFNLRVTNLAALLARLKRAGVKIEAMQEFPYGKFGWVIDPEGRKIELWEPPAADDAFAGDDGGKKKPAAKKKTTKQKRGKK